jgi:hypothetical protein
MGHKEEWFASSIAGARYPAGLAIQKDWQAFVATEGQVARVAAAIGLRELGPGHSTIDGAIKEHALRPCGDPLVHE